MLLEQGELRRIKLGSREVIRRIYSSLRGPNWEPIPAVLSGQEVVATGDSFHVHFTLTHQQPGFHFVWRISLQGSASGTLVFKAQGRSLQASSFNRASLCLLLPLREYVGQFIWVKSPGGLMEPLNLPEAINPHQPFLDLESLAHQIEPEVLAQVTFSGETFEMEDQRNWSDGSFKIYSPPQARPKPSVVDVGWETNQSVTLELVGKDFQPLSIAADPFSSPAPLLTPNAVALLPGQGEGRPLPTWGFGSASHKILPGVIDITRIQALAPTHLRANYWLTHPSCPDTIIRSTHEAKLLNIPLEVALLIPEQGMEDALANFAEAFGRMGSPVLRWLILSNERRTTPIVFLSAARKYLQALAPAARFTIGSNEDFVLLNRNRPDPDGSVDLAFAVSPQVHLNDNRTLVEALEGQASILRSFASLWPNKKSIVTAITLKRSPLSASLKSPTLLDSPDSWKGQVDARQFSLFGAGWTLGSLKRLALEAPDSGLSATFYETTGLLGLLSGQHLGPDQLTVPDSDLRLDPGWVYPLYHVFADFAEFRGGYVTDLFSNDPLRFDGVILTQGNRRTLLLANLEEISGHVRVPSPGALKGIRRLNEKNAMLAMQHPEDYRARPYESITVQDGSIVIEMMPFEWVRVDWE